MRPSFEQIYMKLALDLEKRSTCDRKSVGCVITSIDYRKVLALGYNGNAEKLSNGCDHKDQPGACGCLHGEENAIINCDSPRYVEKIVFTTWSPCMMCTKRLINLGNVKKVYYNRDYTNLEGLNILNQAGILTEKLEIVQNG